MAAASHAWQFFRAGGFAQPRLETGEAIVRVGELDQKLWAALACPTRGLECDARTLALMDRDADGRIRAPELIAACAWVGEALKDPEVLARRAATLSLDAFAETAEGRRLRAAAKAVLAALGRPEASALSVEELGEARARFEQAPFNGDGVVPVESADGAELRAVASQLLECVGGATDLSGRSGFDAGGVARFFAELEAYASWHALADADPSTHPLRGDTEAAHAAFAAVRAKIDDAFARFRLAAFDGRALTALNRDEKEYGPILERSLSFDASEVAGFPLCRVEAGRTLPLVAGLNPAWADAIHRFAEKAVRPLLGGLTELTEAEWLEIRAAFAPFERWQALKRGAAVERLGRERVSAILAGDARAQLEGLLSREKEQEATSQALTDVERIVRYGRDLFGVANNFVAFPDFYRRSSPAHFQAGTLYLDERAFELCVRVDDLDRHATMASAARLMLVYCECSRPATKEHLHIAAAVTAGEADRLVVGRNGLFYDRQGRDWDARIVRVVDAPVSVRQAFWSPYKRLIRFVEEQATKRAVAAETGATDKLTGATAAALDSPPAAAPAPGAPPAAATAQPKRFDVGTVAALGVAVGGITAALGALLDAMFGLGWLMPLGLLALLLCVSGPSMAVAWLKVRSRGLAPLLDANGWALNAPLRVNQALGASLTRVATLPPGARADLADPFRDEPLRWRRWLLLALIAAGLVAYGLGVLDPLLPASVSSARMLEAVRGPH